METSRQFLQQEENSASADKAIINDNNNPYITLSQFDMELQQQAQLAMQQEIDVWKDFENYLSPVEYKDTQTLDNQCQTNAQQTPENNKLDGKSSPIRQTHKQQDSNEKPIFSSPVSPLTCNKNFKSTSSDASNSPWFNSPEFHSSDSMHQQPKSPEQNLSNNQTMFSQQLQQPSPVSLTTVTPLETPLDSPHQDIFTSPLKFKIPQFQSIEPLENSGINDSLIQGIDALSPPYFFPIEQPSSSSLTEKSSNTTIKPVPIVNIATTRKDSIPQEKKSAHNAIERRYRNNINDRITELKNTVPALVHAKLKDSGIAPNKRSSQSLLGNDEDDDEEDGEELIDGVTVATKLNKATILRKSTEYILHLKRNDEELHRENETLQLLLAQLPSGRQALGRYRQQRAQREQEIERQQLQNAALQKHSQRQQRKGSGRKRTRRVSETQGGSYDLEMTQIMSTPLEFQHSTQRPYQTMYKMPRVAKEQNASMKNQVFMALFMAISFFSSSPLSAGPSTKDQYESHKHISRTAEELFSSNNSSSVSFLSNVSLFSDTWSTIRTTLFMICLIQLLFPLFRFWLPSGFKVRKVNKKSRTASAENKSSLNGNIATHTTSLTPGDQKCMQIYNILVSSLEKSRSNKSGTVFPQKDKNPLRLYSALFKEIARFVCRHWLGYEILYDDQNLTPQEQWVQACKWIKLNEVECLGGNPDVTRVSMLYSCFHMLNLIELMEDDENEYVEQSRSRVYATTAMQMALVIPHHGIAEKISKYFWRLAMYESGLEDDPLMRALIFDCHEDDGEDRMELMLASRAWSETLEVMNQQIEHFGKPEARGLSLSMTAPVLVPVGILSTLHLLDNLQTQFGRLIISVTAKPLTADMVAEESKSDFNETAFALLMDITDSSLESESRVGDYHRLAHWLAAVGATVDALWKSDVKTAEKLLKTLVQNVPRSLVSREIAGSDIVCYKERMNQLDELTKKSIIHTLVGATWLKKESTEYCPRGVEELQKAEQIKAHIKRIMANASHIKQNKTEYDNQDLESSVLALAEFVTAVTGLEAWICAWRLAPVLAQDQTDRNAWEEALTEQVHHASLNLRRMIRRHSLDGLRTNQAIIERLSRLGAFVSNQIDEVDSEDDGQKENDLLTHRSKKALEILRGLS
ncbi:uncharacterized protein B0P05DRAFT_557396 [Gilbertella persicaria]|uniref:BHLH domain-containing protein n=1 Tax=Rhizopus stolonifer TaxID=4846 RepID=A0A367KXM5_RHIST|nr:uncharacterized protein B0P05DRAFT_557396 [Gilbertella persicaria]KAI8061531.1 hypothetical protein B0P05DRAFT_557396 [Gilbertella persicaria]RCI06897.1 hypothetical protein CU098_009043 [Rhizopus stolonifer]